MCSQLDPNGFCGKTINRNVSRAQAHCCLLLIKNIVKPCDFPSHWIKILPRLTAACLEPLSIIRTLYFLKTVA